MREEKTHYSPSYILQRRQRLVFEIIVEGTIAFLEHAILAPLCWRLDKGELYRATNERPRDEIKRRVFLRRQPLTSRVPDH